MKHLLPLVLLLTCCSGRVDMTGFDRQPLTTQTLTVCPMKPGDREFAEAIIAAVNYWWEQGDDVEYADGPYCLVRVRLDHTSHVPERDCYDGNRSVDGWCNGEVGIETHQEYNGKPHIDGFAPAMVTIRLEPWQRMTDAERIHTIAHEIGHALGHPHSAVMPMRSCEREEWCFGKKDIEQWWNEQN